jgi:hypothetical protein
MSKGHDLEQLGEETAIILTGPVVLHEGRYRLYQTPDGGMRIQYRRDDKTEDDFVQIPGPIVALSKAAAEGKLSPMELMKRTMSIMNQMRQ